MMAVGLGRLVRPNDTSEPTTDQESRRGRVGLPLYEAEFCGLNSSALEVMVNCVDDPNALDVPGLRSMTARKRRSTGRQRTGSGHGENLGAILSLIRAARGLWARGLAAETERA